MKHHRWAALAVLLLLSLVPVGPVLQSASAQDCATPEAVAEQIRHETPNADLRLINGQQAARLRAGISSLIGKGVPDGGSYLIAHKPGTLAVYVVRFANGCATHHGRFPDRLVQAWLDGSPA
jgi:hypothetical protein